MNALPMEVVHASSVDSFKNKLAKCCDAQEFVFNYRAGFKAGKHRIKLFLKSFIKIIIHLDIEAHVQACVQ